MRQRHAANSDRIAKTVDAGLCHSCGACHATCPVGAICFRETVGGHVLPTIDEQLCTECGLCLKVCAGLAANHSFVQALPLDPFAGVTLGSWIGRADDAKVYAGAQSGGVVSQLLIDLVESGMVDACAVVKMVPGNPPRPTAFLARSKQEILEAQKSKYCPVPILAVLREIERTNHRIAMVGLGCHFHGLSLMEKASIDVASALKLKIGLICEGTLTLAAVDYLLKTAGQRAAPTRLVFKDKRRTGYPGDVTIENDTGDVSIVPKSERMAIKDVFTPARCRLCFDKMNVLSDVTVGDPWGIEGADIKHGESVIIARTEPGRSAVMRGLDRGQLSLRSVDYEEILAGQRIDSKRADWRTYCETWQTMGKELPGFCGGVARQAPLSQRLTGIHRRRLDRGRALDTHTSREAVLTDGRLAVRLERLRRYLTRGLGIARRLLWRETRRGKGGSDVDWD